MPALAENPLFAASALSNELFRQYTMWGETRIPLHLVCSELKCGCQGIVLLFHLAHIRLHLDNVIDPGVMQLLLQHGNT